MRVYQLKMWDVGDVLSPGIYKIVPADSTRIMMSFYINSYRLFLYSTILCTAVDGSLFYGLWSIALPLPEQRPDVVAQPVPLQHLSGRLLRAVDPAETLAGAARAAKGLRHLPLGAGIEEAQLLAGGDGAGAPDLQRTGDGSPRRAGQAVCRQRRRDEAHVGVARVVAVEQVGVELDVGVAGCLLYTSPSPRDS